MQNSVKLVSELIDVTADQKLGKALAKAYAGKTSRAAIVKLLGDRVEANRLPTWISWSTGGLDTIGHLGDPMFSATTADEDEFYSFEDGPQLVMQESGGLQKFDGKDESFPRATAADVAKLTAYDGGGYLLAKLRWVGPPPPTIAAAKKLLAAAFSASGSGLAAYEKAEPAMKSAKEKANAAAPAAEVRISAMELGGPMRSGCYATHTSRKTPKVVWWSDNDNSGTEYGGNPVIDEELGLVFAGNDAFNARVSATRISDGKKAWKIILTKNQSWLIGSATVGGGVLYQGANKQVFAIDAKKGKVKWTANLSGVQGSSVIAGGELLVGTADGVVALSLDKGRKQWTFAVKRDDVKLGVRGGIAMAGNIIYFTANEKLFAVDLATKKAVWTMSAVAYTTPSLDETSVYTWTKGGLTAVDRVTGKPRWTAKTKKAMSGYGDGSKTIAVGADRLVVRQDGRVVAYDKAKGKLLWTYSYLTPYGIGDASPIIAGDVVLCVLVDDEDSDKRILCAVDLATGKRLWDFDKLPYKNGTARPSWYCTPAIAADGTVLVQGYTLCALR